MAIPVRKKQRSDRRAQLGHGRRRAKRNDRLIAVSDESHRYGECADLRDISEAALDEIEQFFVAYNVQKGGRFRPLARRGKGVAARLVERGARRFASARA